jgi:hypothetical protein
MTNNANPPFFQLGRRISFRIWNGTAHEDVAGEVMDTDIGWIAVKDDATAQVRWFNLDYIVSITVLGRVDHA